MTTIQSPNPPPATKAGVFFFLSLLFLAIIALPCLADWNQRGGDAQATREAHNAKQRFLDDTRTLTACDLTIPNSYGTSEPLIINNEHTNNTIIAFTRTDGPNPANSLTHLHIAILNATGAHNCGMINNTIQSFSSSDMNSTGWIRNQPASTNRSNSTRSIIVPAYEQTGGGGIGNLSVIIINISNNNDAPIPDKTIKFNYTTNRTVGQPSLFQIGTAATVRCASSDLCAIYSPTLGGLACAFNITSGNYACQNLTLIDWTGYNDLQGGNREDPGKFTLFLNGTRMYIRAMVMNTTMFSPPGRVGETFIVGYEYLIATNTLINDLQIALIRDPGPNSFAYLYTDPAIIEHQGSFVTDSNNRTLIVGVSQQCSSTSAACGNGQDNTTLNRVFAYNAFTGVQLFEYDNHPACSPNYWNTSLDLQNYFPRIGDFHIIPRQSPDRNVTWACATVQSPNVFNYSTGGEAELCNFGDQRNIAGMLCYDLTPVTIGTQRFNPTKAQTLWPVTSLNSTMQDANQNSTNPPSITRIERWGPAASPFGIVHRQRATWNQTISGAWAFYENNPRLYGETSQQNITTYFFGAKFLEPYTYLTRSEWIPAAAFDFAFGNGYKCLQNNGLAQAFRPFTPKDNPSWSTNPVSTDSSITRPYLCEFDHLFTRPADNATQITSASYYQLYQDWTVYATLFTQSSVGTPRNARLIAFIDYPANHSELQIEGFTTNTNIFDACNNTAILYRAIRTDEHDTNETWYLSANCNGDGETLTFGSATNTNIANVTCTYNRTGLTNTTVWANDYFITQSTNNSFQIPVNVTNSASCFSAGTGAHNDTNATTNQAPGFGIVVRTVGNICANQTITFKVENYTNDEANDTLFACVIDYNVTRNTNGSAFTFPFTNKKTCGQAVKNGTAMTVKYQAFIAGTHTLGLYITDQAHLDLTLVQKKYDYIILDTNEPNTCAQQSSSTTDNERLTAPQDFVQNVRAGFAQIGLTSRGSQLGAYGVFSLGVAMYFFSKGAPPIAIILLLAAAFIGAILLELIPVYFIIVGIFIIAAGLLLRYLLNQRGDNNGQ